MATVRLFLSFTGRIPRSSYWFGLVVIFLVLWVGRYVLKYHLDYGGIGGREELSVTLLSVVAAIPLAALSVKRFNEVVPRVVV